MKALPLLALVLLGPMAARADNLTAKAGFDAWVKRVYNFNPDNLAESQARAKEEQLDEFWYLVAADKSKFLPLLRAKVADSKSRPYFRYDGANLLVEIAPSLKNKRLQVDIYTASSLDFIDESDWVCVLSERGFEGFDVSKAARRALDDESIAYTSPLTGEEMSNTDCAQLLWGSQSEERSTPQLFALASDRSYPQREAALGILMTQATIQSRDLVQRLDQSGMSNEARDGIEKFLRAPTLVAPRDAPKTTRPQFLRAFYDLLKGDSDRFWYLTEKVSDGPRDAAAVLRPTDLPLLRRVRRHFLLAGTGASLAYYRIFTGIIFAVMQKETRT